MVVKQKHNKKWAGRGGDDASTASAPVRSGDSSTTVTGDDDGAKMKTTDQPPHQQTLLEIFSKSPQTLGKNIYMFLAFFAPTIITISILLLSIFSGTIGKGLFYIFCMFVASAVRIIILWTMDISPTSLNTSNDICNLSGFLPYDNASYSIFILCFTAAYFILPMFLYGYVNYWVIIFFCAYIIFDIIVKLKQQCTSMQGLIGDLMGGVGLGCAISSFIYMSPIRNWLFINEIISDKKVCTVPTKQKFKCAVYKNGELITSQQI